MDGARVAMVFAHPGHEILVAGMLQRYRPAVLFLTRADSGGDAGREAFARAGLERLGLTRGATFLGLPERESYRWALDGDVAAYRSYRSKVLEWLRRVRPTVVFGDAFELSNFHHDLTRVMLDSAWREYAGLEQWHQNYELPSVCRTDEGLMNLRFQEFPDGGHETFELTSNELARKRELIDWVSSQYLEVAFARGLFPSIAREVYRRSEAERDYTQPPAHLRRHYDEWGQHQVQLGRYPRAITFSEHFVPIARALLEGESCARKPQSPETRLPRAA